jgi:hypothetical protein
LEKRSQVACAAFPVARQKAWRMDIAYLSCLKVVLEDLHDFPMPAGSGECVKRLLSGVGSHRTSVNKSSYFDVPIPTALVCLDSGQGTALNNLIARYSIHNALGKLKVGAERLRNLSTSAEQHRDRPKEEINNLGVAKHCLTCIAQLRRTITIFLKVYWCSWMGGATSREHVPGNLSAVHGNA